MSGRSGFEPRDSGWQGLLWAASAAALVTLVLIAGVALAWAVGNGPATMPPLTAQVPQTPTPRALSFAQSVPSATAPPAAPTATAAIATEEPQADVAEMVIVATPKLADAASDGEPEAESSTASFAAATEDAYQALASGSWSASSKSLVNGGTDAVSERWLPVTTVRGSSFVVNAEIRVLGTLDSVCDQSFGIAGGSPAASLVFGGGVIYPCSGGSPVARLSDVSTWEDGYNADPILAERAFEPGDRWRTYHFELQDGRLRLLVDDEEVLNTVTDPGIDAGATDVEIGLWSQGVELEIRNVAVQDAPA